MVPARNFPAVIGLLLVLSLPLTACEIPAPGDTVIAPPAAQEPSAEEIESTPLGPVVETPGFTGTPMMLAGKLLTREIDNVAGEELGQIEDLMIDVTTGNVILAIVEHGGFLDIGDVELPVPLSVLMVGTEADEFVLNLDEETFENFPEIGDDWPGDFSPGWADEISRFWADAGFDVERLQNLEQSRILLASRLVDYTLDGFDAPGLGQVRDLVIDIGNSRVQYVVLSLNDTDFYGSEWRLVPFSVFRLRESGDELALTLAEDFDPELLAGAPALAETTLLETDLFDPAWDDEIAAYWRDAGLEIPEPE